MPDRVQELLREVGSLEKLCSDAVVSFNNLLTEWGEPKQTKTEEFFGMLAGFRENYDRTEKEIKAQRIKEEKERKQKEEEEKRAAAAKKREELALRRERLEAKKAGVAAVKAGVTTKTAEQKQEEDAKFIDEAFKDAAASAISTVKTGAAFKKRRLRRQDTLREKRKQAAKNAGQICYDDDSDDDD
eukprot:TRINITY_DN5913_c0_g1_i7.p1 TRINITY_DN5913_c0_g1~~TRINITY_DN5913_c0_g1_i7.p1  ORF type:complete len:214 (+),score=87.35 TRINITY_DN5913_c0_g1_i7:87-644(+)